MKKRIFLLFILSFISCHLVFAAKKALVIGNNAYTPPLSYLVNPISDAEKVAYALQEIGFSVTLKKDLSSNQFQQEIRSFSQNLSSNDIAFIYYAGHGIALDGVDYLLPTSPAFNQKEDIENYAIEAQELLDEINRHSLHTILVLDACRDNVFNKNSLLGLGNLVATKDNNGHSSLSRSSYIFYAARLGEAASDSGLFAQVLAQGLRKSQTLEEIRAYVSREVRQATHGGQTPNASNFLNVANIYLNNESDVLNLQSQTPKELFQEAVKSYEQGDYQKARQIYEKLAADNYGSALLNLGSLYELGHGVTQDFEKARFLYIEASKHNLDEADYNLGLLYTNGKGVKTDHQLAKYWFERAAKKNNSEAQYNLGVMYFNGVGMNPDYQQARYWLQKAANQGVEDAQSALGILQEMGY